MQTAVILLSGGIDSATCLALAKASGFECHALTIGYGQRHQIEIDSARAVAQQLGASSHKLLQLDLRAFGGSALTDASIAVPAASNTTPAHIPLTYVPARNTIFLSLALAWAEVLPADDIFIGVGAVDYSGYPDCRPAFIRSFEETANLAAVRWLDNEPRLRIHAPLLELPKYEVILRGAALGVDYALTHSCYDPSSDGAACARCDSCRIRMQAFAAAKLPDPTRYLDYTTPSHKEAHHAKTTAV